MKYNNILFMGTGMVGSACLKIIANSVGNKKLMCLAAEKESIPTIKPVCRRLEIPYEQLSPVQAGDYLKKISENTLIISAHNSYLFSKDVVNQPNIKIINFHNAYLPYYRGRNAPTWAIYDGAQYSGATWHEVDDSIDTGGIIVQEKVFIETDETALSLLMRCAKTGIELLRKNIDSFLDGEYCVKKNAQKKRLYLSQELPNNGYLDTNWDFYQAYRFLRAMDYKPMDVLPLPRVELGGIVYEIAGYEIKPKEFEQANKSFVIPAEDGINELRCNLEEV